MTIMPQATDKPRKKSSTKTAPLGSAPWSVRGVSPEARNAAALAARRAGRSVGEWVEGVVMAAAHAELKAASVPAATGEDTLKAILAQLEKRDEALGQLAAKVEAMERKGWLARLFSR